MLLNIKLPGKPQPSGSGFIANWPFNTEVTRPDGGPIPEVTKIKIEEIDYSSDRALMATVEVIIGELDLQNVEAELFTTIGGKRYRLVEVEAKEYPLCYYCHKPVEYDFKFEVGDVAHTECYEKENGKAL